MITATGRSSAGRKCWTWGSLAARMVLGAVFLLLGLSKAADPPTFLRALHQYHHIASPPLLNLTAVTLPWVEIVCGVFLIAGLAVRGAALVAITLLVAFSLAIVHRALGLSEAEALPFCAIHFDCGCGSGVVAVCRKLVENLFLLGLGVVALVGPVRSRSGPRISRSTDRLAGS